MEDFPYNIRVLETHDDYYRAEEAQRTIWKILDDTAVVPLHVLITAQKNGGLVAGAFDHRDRMIGFLYGFLGFTKSGRPKHCSHLMGVLPDLRRGGVGEAIKRFQRSYVMKQGLNLITWTFDPLEGVNAALNVGKLRSVARTYYRNLYGDMADSLNKGIPTDRFEVEWWLDETSIPSSERSSWATVQSSGVLIVNPALRISNVVMRPGPRDPRLESGSLPEELLVEIPPVYQSIKQASMELAGEWRYHSRSIFERLFSLGYVALDFVSEDRDGERHNYYYLKKDPLIPHA